jgi:hypothetical protein
MTSPGTMQIGIRLQVWNLFTKFLNQIWPEKSYVFFHDMAYLCPAVVVFMCMVIHVVTAMQLFCYFQYCSTCPFSMTTHVTEYKCAPVSADSVSAVSVTRGLPRPEKEFEN